MKKLRHFQASKLKISVIILWIWGAMNTPLQAQSMGVNTRNSAAISQHIKLQLDSIETYIPTQPQQASNQLQHLLPLVKKLNYGYYWGKFHQLNAKVEAQQQHQEKAIKYNFDALKAFQKNRQPLEQSKIYLALGSIFDQQQNHEKAIDYYLVGLQILKKHVHAGNSAFIQFYTCLGLCHLELSHFVISLEYLNKAKVLAQTHHSAIELCQILQLIGRNYTLQDQYQEASQTLNQAQEIARQQAALELEMHISNDLSRVNLMLGQSQAARQAAQRKKLLAQQLQHQDCFNLSNYLIAKSFLAENKLDSAYFYNKQALKGAEAAGRDSTTYEVLIQQGAILAKQQQAYAAIQALEQAQIRKNNLASNAQRLKAERIRQEMTVSRVEKQIQHQIEAQVRWECLVRYSMFFVLFVAALLSLFYLFKVRIRERANQQLKLQNAQIEVQKAQLQQLSHTKDQLFAVVSHDLRSPLLAIQAVLDTLNEPDLDQQDRQHWLSLLHQQTAKTSVMLENLLYWANIQMNSYQPAKENLKLQPIVEDLSESIRLIFAEKAVQIRNSINPEFTLYSDPGVIRMALRNLLANAVKFSHTGQEVEVSAHTEKDGWVIQIKDYGIGMSEDQLHKALKGQLSRFGTKGEVGSGMGLSLVRQFIENQGGKLHGQGRINQGCSFTIILPAQVA